MIHGSNLTRYTSSRLHLLTKTSTKRGRHETRRGWARLARGQARRQLWVEKLWHVLRLRRMYRPRPTAEDKQSIFICSEFIFRRASWTRAARTLPEGELKWIREEQEKGLKLLRPVSIPWGNFYPKVSSFDLRSKPISSSSGLDSTHFNLQLSSDFGATVF